MDTLFIKLSRSCDHTCSPQSVVPIVQILLQIFGTTMFEMRGDVFISFFVLVPLRFGDESLFCRRDPRLWCQVKLQEVTSIITVLINRVTLCILFTAIDPLESVDIWERRTDDRKSKFPAQSYRQWIILSNQVMISGKRHCCCFSCPVVNQQII